MKKMSIAAVAAILVLALAACGGSDGEADPPAAEPAAATTAAATTESGATSAAEGQKLTVYSGREEELVGPLLAQFEKATGVDVEVRYGESAELAAAIAEEGGNSPADVFFAQDPGSLGAVADKLAPLPQELLDRIDARWRDSGGRWVGTSGRSRVLIYNTEKVAAADLPSSVLDLTDPTWKGRVGIAPTNASFQAFVTALRLSAGDDAARAWLEGVKANDVKTYEGNTAIVEATAAGEVDLGLVNHYYLYLVQAEQPDAPIANHYFAAGDPGALVSVAGAGVLASTDQAEVAQAFVGYLLSDEGQRFYVDAAETEYPLVAGIPAKEGLPPIADLQGPDVDLSTFGAELEATVELLRETGLLT